MAASRSPSTSTPPRPKRYPFFVLDVFTSTRFQGNQLAVVLVTSTPARRIDRATQQTVAREFGFSETVFLHESLAGAGRGEARCMDIWTGAGSQLEFAGHPTIGALCYIAQEEGDPNRDQILHLELKAGPVLARYDGDTAVATATIPHAVRVHAASLPIGAVTRSQPQLENVLLRSPESDVWKKQRCPIVSPAAGTAFILVELATVEQHLNAVFASSVAIKNVSLDPDVSVAVVAPFFYVLLPDSGSGVVKCRTRMVEAEIGEDPATGSASCALAAYLALQKGGPLSRHAFQFEQGVEMGRRSIISVEVDLDGEGRGVSSISLAGQAVVTMRGTLDL